MSTDYYRIAPPSTKLRAEPLGETHTRLTYWTNQVLNGTLTLRNEELPQMLLLLRSSEPLVNRYFGAINRRSQLYPDPLPEPDNLQLISEYGELTTLGELRSKVGTGAK